MHFLSPHLILHLQAPARANVIGTYQGLSNSDEDGRYIGFKMSDRPQISVGNTLCTIDGLEEYQIIKISHDRYNGNPELLKAYY